MTLEEEECIWFENTRDVNDPWIEDDHNDATEAMTIPEIAASGNGGGIICARNLRIIFSEVGNSAVADVTE